MKDNTAFVIIALMIFAGVCFFKYMDVLHNLTNNSLQKSSKQETNIYIIEIELQKQQFRNLENIFIENEIEYKIK